MGHSKHKHIDRALDLNSKLKCVYKKEFEDSNGFFFDDLKVYKNSEIDDDDDKDGEIYEESESPKENFENFSLSENEKKNKFLSDLE